MPPSSSNALRMLIALTVLLPFETVAKISLALAAGAFILSADARPYAAVTVAVVLGLTKLRKRYALQEDTHRD